MTGVNEVSQIEVLFNVETEDDGNGNQNPAEA